jgi:integrative and conjugative element protein (TIGR02256 family)
MRRRRFQDATGRLPFLVLFGWRAFGIMQSRIQTLPLTRESGGQMFGVVENGNIIVTEVTGLRKKDVRTRTSLTIDIPSANAEIAEHFERGLHYLGDWHTHPQDVPEPSQTDRENAGRLFKAAANRPCLVMAIVARNRTYVGVHNAKTMIPLTEVHPPRNRWL